MGTAPYAISQSIASERTFISRFVGLTAYDAQKIKQMHADGIGTEEDRKAAILGALALYLDFINLFLYLLRLFGRRK